MFILFQFIDIRLAVLGNVDVGKSTLVGVLTQGELDNGRGRARLNLFRHLHEIESGRTSSISHEILGFNSKGQVNFSDINQIHIASVFFCCTYRHRSIDSYEKPHPYPHPTPSLRRPPVRRPLSWNSLRDSPWNCCQIQNLDSKFLCTKQLRISCCSIDTKLKLYNTCRLSTTVILEVQRKYARCHQKLLHFLTWLDIRNI